MSGVLVVLAHFEAINSQAFGNQFSQLLIKFLLVNLERKELLDVQVDTVVLLLYKLIDALNLVLNLGVVVLAMHN